MNKTTNKTTIWHNPRCSKSREALALVQKKVAAVEIVEYLKEPPSEKELERVLKMLGKTPEQLIRTGEPLFKEKFKGKERSAREWIQILHQNPVLIERPIVIAGSKACVARPPELALELL